MGRRQIKKRDLYTSYSQLQNELRKFLPSYEKTRKYLTGSNIYGLLKPKQSNARNNAEKVTIKNQTSSYSDIYKILDYLNIPKC